MANKPISYLNWTDGAPSKVVQPPSNFSLQGWQAAQAPPFQYMNWLFWLTDQWIQYLDQIIETGVPDNVIRLLNGGIWSFNASTGVLAWSQAANLAIPSIPDSANTIAAGNVTLADGDVAYVIANVPIVTKGDGTITQSQITNLNFTGNLVTGMVVSGPGVQPGTTVSGVFPTSVNISLPLTATTPGGTFIFASNGPITMQVLASTALIPTINTILIARRQGNIVYLGVNTSQMVLRDGEFKPLLGSGYFDIYTATAGENLSAGTVVYISAGASDSGRTAGDVYKLDASAAYATKRSTFAGVVITTVTAGQTATLLFNGFFAEVSLTPGLQYYADPTIPGAITTVIPTGTGQQIVPVGFAVTTTALLVNGGTGSSSPVPALLLFYQETLGFGNGAITAFTTTQPVLNGSSIFVFLDGGIVPNSKYTVGGNTVTFNSAPALGQRVYVEYVLANQIYLSANQEIPQGTPNGVTTIFPLSGTPINTASMFVFIDGEIIPSTDWNLIVVAGVSKIQFTTAPALGQSLYTGYFTPVGGGVSGAQNDGGAVGVFRSLLSGVLHFNSLLAGANITIIDNLNGTISIASSGGGSSRETHGSAGAPIAIVPGTGIVPTTAMDQVWWIMPSAGAGAVPITATPPISAGATVGQRLSLKSVASANYLTLPNVSGVDQDGVVDFGPYAQTINYTWDGTNWSEDSRRV